jgi:hypothetical protein
VTEANIAFGGAGDRDDRALEPGDLPINFGRPNQPKEDLIRMCCFALRRRSSRRAFHTVTCAGLLYPTIVTLFAAPNHPSYPSAHAFVDAPYAAVLGYLFPRDKDYFEAQANEAAVSRLTAGIHFRSDIEVGLALGRAVAERAIERVRNDGSH